MNEKSTERTSGKTSMFSIMTRCADAVDAESNVSFLLQTPHDSKKCLITPVPKISQIIKIPD